MPAALVARLRQWETGIHFQPAASIEMLTGQAALDVIRELNISIEAIARALLPPDARDPALWARAARHCEANHVDVVSITVRTVLDAFDATEYVQIMVEAVSYTHLTLPTTE